MDLKEYSYRYGNHGVGDSEEPLKEYLLRERCIDIEDAIQAMKLSGFIAKHPNKDRAEKGQHAIYFPLGEKLDIWVAPFVLDYDEETKEDYIFIKTIWKHK